MRRAVAATTTALGLAAIAIWGCASSGTAPRASERPAAELAHDWQHYEPDGGWAAYVPAHEPAPHSMEAAAGADPQIDVIPIGPSGSIRSPFRSY